MDSVNYRDYSLEPRISIAGDGSKQPGKYVADYCLIQRLIGGKLKTTRVCPKEERYFTTKEEAEMFITNAAKLAIDRGEINF